MVKSRSGPQPFRINDTLQDPETGTVQTNGAEDFTRKFKEANEPGRTDIFFVVDRIIRIALELKPEKVLGYSELVVVVHALHTGALYINPKKGAVWDVKGDLDPGPSKKLRNKGKSLVEKVSTGGVLFLNADQKVDMDAVPSGVDRQIPHPDQRAAISRLQTPKRVGVQHLQRFKGQCGPASQYRHVCDVHSSRFIDPAGKGLPHALAELSAESARSGNYR